MPGDRTVESDGQAAADGGRDLTEPVDWRVPPEPDTPGGRAAEGACPERHPEESDEGAEPDTDDAEMVSTSSRIRGVLRGRDFRRLWIVMGLSSLGDWLGFLAQSALVTAIAPGGYAAQNVALGGLLIVRLAPSALLGPVAGAFADRFDRRYTMVTCDVVRFGLMLSIPLVGSLSWLYVATLLMEGAGLFFNPVKDASVPNLVRRHQIEAANQLSLITTYGITPVGAGILFLVLAKVNQTLSDVSFFTASETDLAFYFNALTFLIAGAVVMRIRGISGPAGSRERVKGPGLVRMFGEGFAFIGSSPLLRGLLIGILGTFAAAGAVVGTGRLYASSLGGGDAAYGALFGAVFVGLGLGIGLGPRAARGFSRRRLFGMSIVLAGGFLVLVAVMPHLVLAMFAVIGVGFAAGIAYLSAITLMGTEVSDRIRGRVFALVNSLVRIALLTSIALVPFLVAAIRRPRVQIGSIDFVIDGTRILLMLAGLLAVGVGIIAYRQMDDRKGVPVMADLMSAIRGDTTTQRRLRRGGVFIVFEGGEGVGKTTQIQRLARWLGECGVTVTVTHEPGATEIGARVRTILLAADGTPLTPRAEALLFAADRAHHVDSVIRPALDNGQVVLSDRFVDSSLAYQGAGRSLPMEEVRRLSRWATDGLEPDLTVLLDADPAIGLDRAHGRTGESDRLEAESLEFHQRVRKAFVALAEHSPDRYLVIDATQDVETVAAAVRQAVGTMLAARKISRVTGAVGPATG